MNTIEYLTKNEYENLKQNIDFTDEELFVIKHLRLNDLTCEGIAQELNVSYHKFKKIKGEALLKIFRQASK